MPKHRSPVAFCVWYCLSSNAIPALVLLWKFGVSWRTWTFTFHCDFFFNYPWHVKVVLRAWVLCQSQPVGTPQHHSAAGDCLLPWQSSKVPGCGDCLRVWGDVCCPTFPHTSHLCKLQLERSKDLRHHFLIGAPKLPFSDALLSTFKLKQLLEQLMTVYFTQQLEFTEATHVFSHRYLFLKRSICSSF